MHTNEWRRRSASVRSAFALIAFVMALGTINVTDAHVTGPSGFEDDFEAPNATPLTQAPTAAYWQISPYVPAGWTIGTRPSTANVSALGTVSVLVASQRQGVPLEPIAFVKKPFGNFEAEVQAAWDRTVPPQSGVGMVFRSQIDPVSGEADRNNFYLFTEVNGPTLRGYPTGHAFELYKRVAGSYYAMAPRVNSFIDFSNSKFHTLKVSMSDNRIIAWVDGFQVFNVVDTPGDDTSGPNGIYRAPGPAFSSGAVGLRTSGTAALFDNLIVIGDNSYEGRATGVNIYGKSGYEGAIGNSGLGGPGIDQGVQAADTKFQYHDHDYNADVKSASVPNAQGAPLGAMLFHTEGKAGTTSSSGQLVAFTGSFTDQSGRTTVNITADAIRASATASCAGTTSTVDVVNLSWQVISRDADGNPTEQQGNVTKLGAAPNTNLLDPNNTTGPLPSADPLDPNNTLRSAPIKLVLHSKQASSDPQRVEAAALRITIFEDADGNIYDLQNKPVSTPGIISMDVAIGDVVAGVICPGAQ